MAILRTILKMKPFSITVTWEETVGKKGRVFVASGSGSLFVTSLWVAPPHVKPFKSGSLPGEHIAN